MRIWNAFHSTSKAAKHILSKIKKNKLTDSKWSYWFFFYFSRLIQKKSKPTTNGYSINTDHRMCMSTMWNNYRYIPDRTEFYKETLQWGVWTIDRTVKCFRSIAVEFYQCTDFVMDRKLAWTSASRNSTPSLTFSKVTMWRPYIMTRSPEFMFQSQLFLFKKKTKKHWW